jgi:glycosyltransferase involved in cell wall biosynthesis
MDISAEVGHPQNHKNSGLAVSIAIACARRDARMRFIFAGSPSPAVPVLEQRIVEAGFSGRIVLAGIRKDIPRLMTASDVLFFPSRAEGLGMVAVEAQAAGLPVLASTTVPREAAVIPELVRFQSLDASEERWVEDLIQLADEPPTDHTAANARVAASAFSIDHSARALVNLYSSGLLV